MLIYLPHLDYGLQKFGPDDPRVRAAVGEIDRVAGELIDFFRRARRAHHHHKRIRHRARQRRGAPQSHPAR
jgi:predicted AlkP superfamily pyrophosphatase or phosphodiesterase